MTHRITANCHYVPQMYLRNFSPKPSPCNHTIWTYDLVVPDAKFPLWEERSIQRVASHHHLYTHIEGDTEGDEFERWLHDEFEDPAADALDRAISDQRLSPEHYRRLIRFVAAQDVRTPARLQQILARGRKQVESFIEENSSSPRRMKVRSPSATSELVAPSSFPMRNKISDVGGRKIIELKAVVGRSWWLWAQRHLLNGVADCLLRHRWKILVAPEGVTWFTSDDPVVRLNYSGEADYTFNGGWNSANTEIFMPLDPSHLLYTSVGNSRQVRNTELNEAVAWRLRRLMAEHAFRHIFSSGPDPDVLHIRPRSVDLSFFLHEKQLWKRWRSSQADAEIGLLPDK